MILPGNADDPFLDQICRNQRIIHKVCHLYAGNEADRLDLFQEILLQMWKSRASFRADAAFTTWMYRIALNTAITALRRTKRRDTEADIRLAADIPADDPPGSGERYEELHAAIRRLHKVDRAIILMYLEELPRTEIAKAMGMTENNVAVRLSRIRVQLRTAIGEGA
jgi:RNA polymerase sigma-70 factor (ECF subfamily)